MFFGYYNFFAYEDFKQYLLDKEYNQLINWCYYGKNKDDILGYLENHLHLNHFIINYVYIRNNYQNGNFKNKDIVKKCLLLAFKTIYIIFCHMNLCLDINREFKVLEIILRKFEEKFRGYIDDECMDYAISESNKQILEFIDKMSENIQYHVDKKKYIDLPDPDLICHIVEGSWRYPSLYYQNDVRDIRFIRNYSGRCQKYYEAFTYVTEKMKKVMDNYICLKKLELVHFYK
jgi:hypothetical protein